MPMVKDQPGSLTGLTGEIERITYNDAISGFTIAQVVPTGRRQPITVVGHLMNPSPGTVIQMAGKWIEHPKFGRQFKAVRMIAQPPVTIEGIGKYLSSGLIKGIGPETARSIVGCFKEKTLDIIEHHPEKLNEVPGIGDKRIALIKKAWQRQQEARDVLIFLQSHGVSAGYAYKIFRQYGQRAIEIVRRNPYRLAHDIFGIGFLMADRIASELGFQNENPMRLRAGILYVLQRLSDEGHLFFPYEALMAKCREILQSPRDPLLSAFGALATERKLIIEDLHDETEANRPNQKAVYLHHYYQYEHFIAQRLHQLLATPQPSRVADTEQAIHWVRKWLKLDLAPSQQQAITMALTSKVLVITGGPGTGKTTIIRAITRLYEHLKARVLLAAPTGRAAKRLSEACGRQAKTIHRLLEYHPAKEGFQKNQHAPLDGDLLVVDEASMIDSVLMYHLLEAVPAGTHLILVGDVNQLPSVGPGNVLKDILASGCVPIVTLKEIFRQARSSRIVVNAHRINAGKMPHLERIDSDILGDFYFISQQDPQKILSIILTLVSQRIPERFGFDAVDDIQVLTPMHRGVIGAQNLNQRLQQALNAQDAHVTRGAQRFGLNDKVMQIRNNYEKNVFNGDIGRITQIEAATKTVAIRFDERAVRYDFTELDELVLAYAISVHKSQGSEYPAAVIPVSTSHYLMLQRNLIYTAITRAKRLVVLVGTRQAMAMAVQDNAPHRRYTRLAWRLRDLANQEIR